MSMTRESPHDGLIVTSFRHEPLTVFVQALDRARPVVYVVVAPQPHAGTIRIPSGAADGQSIVATEPAASGLFRTRRCSGSPAYLAGHIITVVSDFDCFDWLLLS